MCGDASAPLSDARRGCLVFGWRRVGMRWLGVLWLLPAVVLAVDVVWLAPNRPVMAVALDELQVTSEPRVDMDAVATVRRGVVVELGGSANGAFVRVHVNGRAGYVPRDAVGIVD